MRDWIGGFMCSGDMQVLDVKESWSSITGAVNPIMIPVTFEGHWCRRSRWHYRNITRLMTKHSIVFE